jgi:ATP-dependent Clp protease ATP-binding subunit ClpA
LRQPFLQNTLILLTSNAASEQIATFMEDPALAPEYGTIKDSILPELRKHFPAAFLGRMGIVPYLPLGEEILTQIVRLQLARVQKRMQAVHGIALEFAPELVAHIVSSCGQHETGARRLLQFIEQNLLPELARYWLENAHQGAALASAEEAAPVLRSVTVTMENGAVAYQAHYQEPNQEPNQEKQPESNQAPLSEAANPSPNSLN